MYAKESKIFKMRPAEEVIDYIRSNEYNAIETSPKNLSFITDSGRLFVCGTEQIHLDILLELHSLKNY